MKIVITTLCSCLLLAPITFANAQESGNQAYFGANYAFLTYEEDGVDPEFDLGALVGKAGAKINPYLSAELRLGFGVSDDSISAGGDSLTLELDHLLGGYAVVEIPNESPITPYAVFGLTQGKLTASATVSGFGASDSESDDDTSYGVGANIAINDEVSLNAEYMNYFDKDDAQISGYAIGMQWLF